MMTLTTRVFKKTDNGEMYVGDVRTKLFTFEPEWFGTIRHKRRLKKFKKNLK